ncbi:hypothetical protein ACFZBP_10295 [Streptomyces sp. NPDC008086]|uniref:hypothetical protein n=1 Tax=Streptomyces sp. NPDC008086 TaxID=3364807 RepID=UPI0036EEE392
MTRQARMQAKSSHGQWLRERRLEAYTALLGASDAVHDTLNLVVGHTMTTSPPPPDDRRAAWRQVNDALKSHDRAARAVTVLGPEAVAEEVTAMREALHNLVSVWRDPADPPADRRAVNDATANQAWEDATTVYLAAVEFALQGFRD